MTVSREDSREGDQRASDRNSSFLPTGNPSLDRGSDPGFGTTRQSEKVNDPVDSLSDESLGGFGEGESKRVRDGLSDGENTKQRVLLFDEGSVRSTQISHGDEERSRRERDANSRDLEHILGSERATVEMHRSSGREDLPS